MMTLNATDGAYFDLVTVFSVKSFKVGTVSHKLSATRINDSHITVKIDNLSFTLTRGRLAGLDITKDGVIDIQATYQGVFDGKGRVTLRLPAPEVEKAEEAPVQDLGPLPTEAAAQEEGAAEETPEESPK